MKKKHLLTAPMGPAYCGVGQGRRFSSPLGYTVDQLPDAQRSITCDRCSFYAASYSAVQP